MENLMKSMKITKNRNIIQNITILLIHCFAIYSIICWNLPLAPVISFYFLRVFLVSAGIHRYFCHKSFRLNRFFQFIFAVGSTLCLQNSVLWWASKHRLHHKFNDKVQDPHSHHKGWFWSHIGWILNDDNIVHENSVKDLTQFKELVFLHKHYKELNFLFASLILLIFGFNIFCSVYCLGTVLAWHTIFLVNSLCHKIGYKNFQTKDDSRNSLFLSVITLGESFHNNHHASPYSANNRARWFEIDLTYAGLYILSLLRVVKLRKK